MSPRVTVGLSGKFLCSSLNAPVLTAGDCSRQCSGQFLVEQANKSRSDDTSNRDGHEQSFGEIHSPATFVVRFLFLFGNILTTQTW